MVYPYSFGEDLQVVRLSSESWNCSMINYGLSTDNCDEWELEIGIAADSFAPGAFPIEFGSFVTYEAAAKTPDCMIHTGGGFQYSKDAVLTIVEVSATSVSVKLTGVSTKDMNGHDVNGAYTAFRCGTP
jgi:hypothetical protein